MGGSASGLLREEAETGDQGSRAATDPEVFR